MANVYRMRMPDMKTNKNVMKPIVTDMQGRLNASICAMSPALFHEDLPPSPID